uniref:Uncharacterized protein n=1 Tax=Panagrolaimus davidi TaxID=227884 RepID=A0A914PAN5_9BILA
MPPDAVKSKETWNFKVIKDDLIEFETSNQRKFVGSPKELMSIVLDSHLNIIKEELGEKMIKKVTFTFFEQFSFEAIEKFGKELEEICKLLQIESCLI